MSNIVLASSSRYRAELLRRIVAEFVCDSPDIDERAGQGENGSSLADRLAEQKALAVAARHADALVIGSDQVALLDADGPHERILGKPGDFDTAKEQLLACSERTVTFYTACCLHNSGNGNTQRFADSCTVTYRALSSDAVEAYLLREQPYDCAGSIKTEGLGVGLMRQMRSYDPGTLMGLPLIGLVQALQNQGVKII